MIPGVNREALSFLMSGQHERALAFLHSEKSPGVTAIRMRALLRARHFNRGIELADQTSIESLVPEEQIAVKALHIFLLARVGELGRASSEMPAFIAAAKNDLAHLEVSYTAAYLDYCAGLYPEALLNLEEILSRTENIRGDKRRYEFQQDEYMVRAKAATLIGVVHGSYDEFAKMEKAHCTALLSAEQSTPRDTFVEALILANLSCLVARTYSASAIHLMQSRARQIKWNAGLEEHRVYIKRHLRMAAHLFNPAVDFEAVGGRSSPSFAFRLAGCADSLVLDDWESRERFLEELVFAKEIVSRVDWQNTDGEEFESLESMVSVLAPFDLESALDAQFRFQEKAASLLPHFRIDLGVGSHSSSAFAAGCIAKAQREWSVASDALEAAKRGWLSSGIVWRSAIAALELFTLTHEQSLLEIPEQYIAAYPNTSFSRRLRRALAMAPGADADAFLYLKSSVVG